MRGYISPSDWGPSLTNLGNEVLNEIKASYLFYIRTHRRPTQTPSLPGSSLHNNLGKEQVSETFSSRFRIFPLGLVALGSLLWIAFSPDCSSPTSFSLGDPKAPRCEHAVAVCVLISSFYRLLLEDFESAVKGNTRIQREYVFAKYTYRAVTMDVDRAPPRWPFWRQLRNSSGASPHADVETPEIILQSFIVWVAQCLQRVRDDRLGRELGGTFYLVCFPAAFLLDLMDLPGIKARGEDFGLLASCPMAHP